MTTSKTIRCIVDDTALITNISEIESWVLRGIIHLVIPLHTIERLHLLKKDGSQIGQNARKAVKFLDDITSHTELSHAVVIQEAEEKYATWMEVESHYTDIDVGGVEKAQEQNVKIDGMSLEVSDLQQQQQQSDTASKDAETAIESYLEKLKLDTTERPTSPVSTPPLSPSSSEPQSSKASPEMTITTVHHDASPVPPTLKDLINSVVWYTYEKADQTNPGKKDLIFLTNSPDTGYLARDFGVTSRNIHQLRSAIGIEEQEAKNHDKYQKKHRTSSADNNVNEPRTLFRYEEASDEEEVVFKPRGRGTPRNSNNRGGSNTGSVKSRTAPRHSPANSLSNSISTLQPKPQIPIEEIDPDSFDRGSFARGNTPLVSVGTNVPLNKPTGQSRNISSRNTYGNGGQSRGQHRGSARGGGAERGSARGRGRLFVP